MQPRQEAVDEPTAGLGTLMEVCILVQKDTGRSFNLTISYVLMVLGLSLVKAEEARKRVAKKWTVDVEAWIRHWGADS